MFVILCIGVVAVVFWISGVVAEAFLVSQGERALAPGVHAATGSPTLRTIARARGEFFVNVKVDGKDLG